jgi:hypothetical protein
MTPDLQAALLCEDVRIEASGSNTLVGVLHAIATPVLPVRVIKLCVFTRWCYGQGEFTQTTRILSEDESMELGKTQTAFRLSDSDVQATNVAVFGGLEFATPGDYPIEILLNNDLKMRFNLRIVLIKQPMAS